MLGLLMAFLGILGAGTVAAASGGSSAPAPLSLPDEDDDAPDDTAGDDDTGDDTTPDTTIPDITTPDITGDDTVPDDTGTDITGDDTGTNTAGDDTVPDTTGPDTTGDDTGTDTAGDDTTPDITIPDTTGDDTGTDTAGDDTGSDIADGGPVGPCPKTGDPVCHCNDDDEGADDAPAGPCPKTGDPVCHCHDDDGDHAGHDGHGGDPVTLPETPEDIAAFVAAVRASPETHTHEHGSPMAGEHMAAMDLVARDEATHIAIANGAWDDPANWHNGEVPGDDARALIPEGVHMTYDHVSDARLFTVRVDGHLDFATDADSQLVVDTMVVSPSGELTIGTQDDPVDPDVNVDIIFANNGAIDTEWDPLLLSRGLIAHGRVDIHGTAKDSHDKVVEDPSAGDTWVDMGTAPEGWAIGDTIVIAGTTYDGYHNWEPSVGYSPSEDEVRVITDIQDGMVYFDEPLIYDHDTPRDDLKTSVANYTRNVSFETENADEAEVHERGHVMFMHNDDVDVRYAEFHELGRTDKSETALNAGEFDPLQFDSNVKGRYAFHFHKAGVEDQDDPGIAIGNSVFGSPGWGFVHHDSHAILENNASFDTFGAGYVAESGNETGEWNDNIAIFAQGWSWKDPKLGNPLTDFDLGRTGDGFWFQGRMVAATDNVAASVNHGYVYFHRGGFDGENRNIAFDSESSEIPGAFYSADLVVPDEHPILEFSGNESFASRQGLYVLKENQQQGHDVHTVLEDFTAWNVNFGADLSYTSHYILKDFDLVGREPSDFHGDGARGIIFGSNIAEMTVVDIKIENFDVGLSLGKNFTSPTVPEDAHNYTVVNPTFIDVDADYDHYDPSLDTILATEDLPLLTPDIALDGPLTFSEGSGPGDRSVEITGTKTDSLGEIDFPTEADNYTLELKDVRSLMEENGYYSTSDGQNYFLVDLYFSDRISGDIYVEKHPVFLNENVPVGEGKYPYHNVEYKGVQDLGGPDDPTFDTAVLWATLTEGQLTLTDEALAMQEEEPEPLLEDVL